MRKVFLTKIMKIIPEKATSIQNFALKEPSEIFQDIECTKDQMVEADSNLERSMKMLYKYEGCLVGIVNYSVRRKQELLKLLLSF